MFWPEDEGYLQLYLQSMKQYVSSLSRISASDTESHLLMPLVAILFTWRLPLSEMCMLHGKEYHACNLSGLLVQLH